MKGLVAIFLGELLLVPLGLLSEEERKRLEEAFDRLPDHMAPSDEDITVLLLLNEGDVVAHRYAWREAVTQGREKCV